MSLGRAGKSEARVVTVAMLLLAASVGVGAVFPAVERVLNTVFLVIGAVVAALYLWVILRDLL